VTAEQFVELLRAQRMEEVEPRATGQPSILSPAGSGRPMAGHVVGGFPVGLDE
jgi:hypothetical protein